MWPFSGLWPKTFLDWFIASHTLKQIDRAIKEDMRTLAALEQQEYERELAEAQERLLAEKLPEFSHVSRVLRGLEVDDPLDEGAFDDIDDEKAYAWFDDEGEVDAYAGFDAGNEATAYAGFDVDDEVDTYAVFDVNDEAAAYTGFDEADDMAAEDAEAHAYAAFEEGEEARAYAAFDTEGPTTREAPSNTLTEEDQMRFAGGVYTFGTSVKPGVYDVTRVSGDGGFGFACKRLDDDCLGDIVFYPLSFFQDTCDTGHQVFPESVHIEAINGSSMVITGSLIVEIRPSHEMLEPV